MSTLVIMSTLVNSTFTMVYKVGCKGVYITRTYQHDVENEINASGMVGLGLCHPLPQTNQLLIKSNKFNALHHNGLLTERLMKLSLVSLCKKMSFCKLIPRQNQPA